MEKSGDTAVFTFGRFNPPTTGHEKLIEAVAKQQKKNAGSKMYVYASQSNDPKKNPLPYAKKIAYMRKMFKTYAKNIITGKPRTAIEVAVELHNKGHRAIVMVVGSDRVQEFDKLLNEYNGVEGKRHGYYGFDNIEVVSAGERDPDAEGIEGMSASKMRVAAADGDFQSFEMGLPSSFSQRKELYRDVRKGMGMREEREMGDMTDMEYLRDLYLTGKIWNAGDMIEAKGVTGHIVRKGTNYVSFADDDGKVHKCWIHEIQLNEAKSNMDKMRDALPKKGRDAWDASANKDKGKPWVKLRKKGSMTTWNVQKGTKDYDKYSKMGFSEEVLDERNYRKEYDNYQGTPEQIARRSSRNKARRIMGDKTKIGMDVGHKDNNPLNNDPSNLRNEVPSDNRREPRLREDGKLPPHLAKFVDKKGNLTKDAEKRVQKGRNKRKIKDVTPKGYGPKESLDEFTISDLKGMGIKPTPDQMKKLQKINHQNKGNITRADLKKVGIKEEQINEMTSPLPWLNKAVAKIHQMTHPKGYEKLVKRYMDGMKDKKHREHPGKWAFDLAREYKGIEGRDFIRYINKLVDKGKLPQELKAEYQFEQLSFKQFVEVLNKNADQDDYIDDFKDSDAPQFKGKSKKKRIAMAVAAYNDKKQGK